MMRKISPDYQNEAFEIRSLMIWNVIWIQTTCTYMNDNITYSFSPRLTGSNLRKCYLKIKIKSRMAHPALVHHIKWKHVGLHFRMLQTTRPPINCISAYYRLAAKTVSGPQQPRKHPSNGWRFWKWCLKKVPNPRRDKPCPFLELRTLLGGSTI